MAYAKIAYVEAINQGKTEHAKVLEERILKGQSSENETESEEKDDIELIDNLIENGV